MYFPELVYVIRKSNSSADQTLNLTLGMVPDLRMCMIDDGHRQLEAACPARETTQEVLSALKFVDLTMERTELDHARNLENIKKALQNNEGTVMTLRLVFCNEDL
jgi:hypothetical protein